MNDTAPLHVHCTHDFGEEAHGRLRDAVAGRVAVAFGPEPGPDTQVLVSGRPSLEMVDACPHLERLVVPWAGIPPAILTAVEHRPALRVHNLHHNGAATAETAVALVLAAAKRLVPHDRALRTGDWSARYTASDSIVLEGASALVLGYGAIGRRVARALHGLGMRVHATRRTAVGETSDEGVLVHPPGHLRSLLPEAQVLVITLPLTEETRGVIGADELAALPPRAVLVNIGRGPIVDERALYEALRDNVLGAAGLDVWYRYPKTDDQQSDCPPSEYPFHELDNVVMSPHRAGSAHDIDVRRMDDLAALLTAIARSDPGLDEVDPARGY